MTQALYQPHVRPMFAGDSPHSSVILAAIHYVLWQTPGGLHANLRILYLSVYSTQVWTIGTRNCAAAELGASR